MNKFFLFPVSFILCAGTLASCDDFFEPKTDDALSGDDYMSSLTEMSTGYLGIMTKMQAVGDKEIFLTDTRGEVLEPTGQSIAPLIAIYNYEDDLTGNEYADPAGYYDVVIACNDYISKMVDFQKNYPELVKETDYFEGLLASAIRVKVWTYMTLAEIYGQALWFDDPITSIKDVNDPSVFQLKNTAEVVAACIGLLEDSYPCNGKSIDPSADFSWVNWIDPEHAASIENPLYRYWDQMTPSHKALMVRLKMWDAAFQDKAGDTAAAEDDYKFVAKTILEMFHNTFVGNVTYWKRGARVSGNYSKIWNYATPNPEHNVSAIIYDYTKNQTNHLLYHFSNEYPNKYLLAPSQAGMAHLVSIDPIGQSADVMNQIVSTIKEGGWYDKLSKAHRDALDSRMELLNKTNNGQFFVGKYRPMYSSVRANAYQDDVHIYTFRSIELYLWLAEAFNHLGRYEAMERIVNAGFNSDYNTLFTNIYTGESVSASDSLNYEGFSPYWTDSKTGGMFLGIRGAMGLPNVDLWNETGHTAAEARQHNDSILANEWMLECACEGKSYPNMIRFAERYSDPTIVSKRVTPKYDQQASAIAAKIESKINGIQGYYVPWNLNVK